LDVSPQFLALLLSVFVLHLTGRKPIRRKAAAKCNLGKAARVATLTLNEFPSEISKLGQIPARLGAFSCLFRLMKISNSTKMPNSTTRSASRRFTSRTRDVSFFRGVAGWVLCFLPITEATASNPQDFYTQSGSDATFEEVMKSGDLPKGLNSTKGFKGSRVSIHADLLRDGPNSRRKIPQEIQIHTLANSSIDRQDFSKWSRWYQEDGNTQIFRLFEGETNLRNTRPLAARIEAFSELEWEKGKWHEWVGTFTIIKPHLMIIFQARNNVNDWSVQLNIDGDGNVILNRRIGEDEVIAERMAGKPFHVRVRDNGLEYEVFLNGGKVGDGSYARPQGKTNFRWGMYRGGRPMTHDAMVLVTGAEVNPRKVNESETRDPAQGESEEPAAEVGKETEKHPTPEGLAIPERKWTNKNGETVTALGVYKAGEDFFSIKVGEKWIVYPLENLADKDRSALLQALDFAEP
jgi:hypothetical protein